MSPNSAKLKARDRAKTGTQQRTDADTPVTDVTPAADTAPVVETETPDVAEAPPSLKRDREEDGEDEAGVIGPAGGPPPADDAKRARILGEQRFPVSQVLHVRGVPPGATDEELAGLVSAVGGTLESLVTIANKQAFFQVDSVETASRMLVRYSDPASPATIRGQPVFIQTSNRSSLQGGRVPGEAGQPGADRSPTILMVIFSDVIYPINVDVLEKVFGPCGPLSKIVIFQKGGQTMALVQYVEASGAAAAIAKLNGQNIYAGCCGMNISYSTSRKDLNVHRESPMGRDFLVPRQQQQQQAPQGGALLPPPPPQRGGYRQQQQQAPYQQGGYQQPQQYQQQAPRGAGGGAGGEGTVVIASQLDPNQINPDYLFRLFGVYGDVLRVKIMFKKRDTALLQFTDQEGAYRAVQFLNNFELWGQPMRCNISKGSAVQMPQEGNPFAAEYGFNHVMHRYRRPDSKALQYVAEPNPILHISSIPLGTTEDEVTGWLSSSGQVLAVKFLADSKYRQALVTMASVQQAVDGLVSLHNRQVQPRVFVKLNFSVAGSSMSKEERLARQTFAPQQRQPQHGGYGTGYGGPPQQHYQQQQYQPPRQQQQQQAQYGGYPPQAPTGYPAAGAPVPPQQPQSSYQQQQYYAGQARK